jgi:hypothetical protein
VIYWHADRPMAWIDPFQGGLGLGGSGGSHGPVAVRGVAQGSLTAQTAVTIPTHQAGDYLVVAIYFTGSTPLTPPTGWTSLLAETDGGSVTTLQVFGLFAVSGSDTFVLGSSVATGVYNSYAVKNATVGKDAIGGGVGTTVSPITAPSVSPTGTQDVLISMFGAGGIPVIGTPSGGITSTAQQTNSSIGLVTGYETLAASGPTIARTATVSGQTEWVGVSLAIK